MSQEARLIEKLRRIEALFARPGGEGERIAAELARERILAQLREVEKEAPAVEYKFSLLDELGPAARASGQTAEHTGSPRPR